MCICSSPKAVASGRHPADGSRFSCQYHAVNAFFGGNGRYAFWHADTQIDNSIRNQFHGTTTGNDFAVRQRHSCKRINRNFQVTIKGRIKFIIPSHEMIGCIALNNIINQDSRNFNIFRIQCAPNSCFFYLCNDNTATSVSCFCNG